ncbi:MULTISPECIES: DUF1622 domain-containing protein [unclassified Pseudofrankia]|uniref:DUF1622 domain-containing protein n=1 Tax=unclassified Pseudofrankia TaxID=2994372 RepID=UPI0008D93E70|nr:MULTISPECIES: DUF1622 domain-containing protein [unclassified Pseudofrankia]MDT3441993.1 DUF1622 domain-containing protein [Pseudofrankia sp. BMG5.37]OHV44615.1 hypothetical protein BCD48_25585 [Pseudofrankia sp. BMG5.36]
MEFQQVLETVVKGVEAAGVAVIVMGTLAATILAAFRLRPGEQSTYRSYRENLGRSILLGLEFLVAADIIRTVAIAPTFTSLGVLGVIVLIRTFLSFAIELEVTGRWPWQKRESD